jgi:hypothetical protein
VAFRCQVCVFTPSGIPRLYFSSGRFRFPTDTRTDTKPPRPPLGDGALPSRLTPDKREREARRAPEDLLCVIAEAQSRRLGRVRPGEQRRDALFAAQSMSQRSTNWPVFRCRSLAAFGCRPRLIGRGVRLDAPRPQCYGATVDRSYRNCPFPLRICSAGGKRRRRSGCDEGAKARRRARDHPAAKPSARSGVQPGRKSGNRRPMTRLF